MNRQEFKKIKLPDSPGVYIFKKRKDPKSNKIQFDGASILYIGKATSLKDRVKSYFSNDLLETRSPLILDMVYHANKIDYIKTDSVLEALILESSLIKKYQPKYNTKEKDDKSYNYVVITKEDFPKVLIERGRNIDNTENKEYKIKEKFGPFTNGTQLKEAVKIVRKIFPFLDQYSEKKTGYTFYRQIGLVPETESGEAKKDYAKIIRNIILFFEGKKTRIIKNLEKEMKTLAKKHEFEKAGKIRNTIFALNHIQDIALIKNENHDHYGVIANTIMLNKGFRIEAYDVAHISGTNTVGVMVVIENGEVNKKEYRKFKINNSVQNDVAGLEEILERRFAHKEWKFPDFVVLDGSTAQKNITQKIFNKLNIKIDIVTVTKDERHRPKTISGKSEIVDNYKKEILLANSEAHRFAITYHKQKRAKSSLL